MYEFNFWFVSQWYFQWKSVVQLIQIKQIQVCWRKQQLNMYKMNKITRKCNSVCLSKIKLHRMPWSQIRYNESDMSSRKEQIVYGTFIFLHLPFKWIQRAVCVFSLANNSWLCNVFHVFFSRVCCCCLFAAHLFYVIIVVGSFPWIFSHNYSFSRRFFFFASKW